MLPTLAPTLAEQARIPKFPDTWIVEVKYDGIRAMAYKENGEVRILNRAGTNVAAKFPAITNMVKALPGDGHIFDGEIAVFDEKGATHLNLVEQKAKANEAVYVMFDAPFLFGRDMRMVALSERRRNLQEIIGKDRLRLKVSERLPVCGATALLRASQRGLEGIVAKDDRSLYVEKRYNRWIKVKCYEEDTFNVAGYTPSPVRPFAALMLVDDKNLYRGDVGSGFTDADLAAIAKDFPTKGKAYAWSAQMPKGVVMLPPGLRVRVRYLPAKTIKLRFPVFVGRPSDPMGIFG